MTIQSRDRASVWVELYWLPLGAGDGGGTVRRCGCLYEALAARWAGRRRKALYHSALRVAFDGVMFVIEMAPVWVGEEPERGVVVEGPVALRWLGRSRWPRYEVRRWRYGSIVDLDCAVESPRLVATDVVRAARLLALVAEIPTLTWGRDELGTGEMWNSNSVTSWLLASSGHDLSEVTPPAGGRAPGWRAGVAVAAMAAAVHDHV